MFSENVHSVLFMIWYILFKLSFQNDGFCCNVALFHCPIYAENFLFTRTLLTLYLTNFVECFVYFTALTKNF